LNNQPKVAGKDVVTGRSATQVKSKKIQFFSKDSSISAKNQIPHSECFERDLVEAIY